jgi:transketolase
VLAPGDAAECQAMVGWATAHQGPVYLRLSRDAAPDLPGDGAGVTTAPGAPRVLREGGAVVLVSTGEQSTRVVEAADALASAGVAARVVHVPWLKPLDGELLADLVGGYPLVVTIEDHSVIGGLGGLVAETLAGHPALRRIVRLGIADTWGESASNAFLLDKHGLSVAAIVERVTRELTARGRS